MVARVLLRKTIGVALLSALLAVVGGCWNPFAPDPGDPPPPDDVQYKLRTSPENVVWNLGTSYEWMNANEYLACLADSFIFHTNPEDQNDPENPLPPYWGKDVETTIHENMFSESSDVDRITLTLTTTLIDFVEGPNPGSNLDDRWLYHEDVDLMVSLENDLQFHATAPVEFLFQIDPGEVGPGGETLWEIIHWWDLSENLLRKGRIPDDGSSDSAEIVTFGRLKSFYRE